MKNYLSAILSLIILFAADATAQNVVVSEYYNTSPQPTGEWTELLVVRDKFDISGYILTDYDGSSGVTRSPQGGVKFKNIDFWKNLREGAIIVIRHRGSSAVDVDKDDGYIEIGAMNRTYFDRFCPPCNDEDNDGEWQSYAMSINVQRDILEIQTPTERHHHSLSHMTNWDDPESVYGSVPAPKINYPGNCNQSVGVAPGRRLSDYAAGVDANNANATIPSLGKPNNTVGSKDENQLFWRELRQPEWSSPSASAEVGDGKVDLSWNAAANERDANQGYLITRVAYSRRSSAEAPVDGKIYSAGQTLGSAVVVANVTQLASRDYADNYKIECGEKYVYNIYPWRYDEDDQNKDGDPKNGRGRSYNEEQYASCVAEKKKPEKPEIEAANDKNVFCVGDSAILNAIVGDGVFSFEWLIDGEFIDDETESSLKISPSQAGIYKYQVKIKEERGCSNISDEFEITVVDYPEVEISAGNGKVQSDTLITLCAGEERALTAFGAGQYVWLKDDKPVPDEIFYQLPVSGSGVYRALAGNSNMCFDTSFAVEIRYIEVDFELIPSQIDFSLSQTENQAEKDFIIKNNSSQPISFDGFDMPDDFELIPPPPYDVDGNSSRTITVRFTPSKSGNSIFDLVFDAPCDKSEILKIDAFKAGSKITPTSDAIDFGVLAVCELAAADTTIRLTNTGTESVEISSPTVAAPFSVLTTDFPISVAGGEYAEIEIDYSPQSEGIFVETLTIPFKSGAEEDELEITLRGEVVAPGFSFTETNVEVGQIPDCEYFVDYDLDIKNISKIDITIANQPAESQLSFENIPLTIAAGESAVLKTRITPSQAGAFSFSAEIAAQPCDLRKTINISGVKSGVVFSFSKDTLDFGTIFKCAGDAENYQATFDISAAGESLETPKIAAIDISDGFSTNLAPNDEIGEGLEAVVNFDTSVEGAIVGELKLTLDPCGREKTVYLKAENYSIQYTLSEDKIDFGANRIGETASKTLTIRNDSQVDITIERVDNIAAPFDYDDGAFPMDLAPGASEDIEFSYIRNDTGLDSLETEIVISQCENARMLTLVGSAFDDRAGAALISIPRDLRAEPGTDVEFSITIEPLDGFDFADADISNIDIYLSYNKTVLKPADAYLGADVVSAIISELSLESDAAGTVAIKLGSIDGAIFEGGEVVALKCESYLGDAASTEIEIDSAIFVSQNGVQIEISTQDGLFTIDSVCSKNLRLVTPAQSGIYYKNLSPNPVREELRLLVTNPRRNNFEIEIFDAVGHSVICERFENPASSAIEAAFPVGKLESGAYFIVLRSSENIKTGKFILIK